MIGALVGIDQIPDYMVKKVMSFDCTKGIGRTRPLILSMA